MFCISGKIGDEVSPPFPGACLHRCSLIVEHIDDNHNNNTDNTKQNMNNNHKNTHGKKITRGRPMQWYKNTNIARIANAVQVTI